MAHQPSAPASPASARNITPSAFTSGVTPTRSAENTSMGRVVPAGPLTKLASTTSSSERVKASSQPAASAGVISGRVTVRKTMKGRAPRSAAASSRLRSSPASRACTTTAT